MDGRDRIEAAFSAEGTDELAAVICYEGIYIRDHWDALTPHPWWYQHSPDLPQQLAWRRDVIARTGQDWFNLPSFYPRARRPYLGIQSDGEAAYLVDERSGQRQPLTQPRIGGWTAIGETQSVRPLALAQSREEIAAAIPCPGASTMSPLGQDGSNDLAEAMLAEFAGQLYPIRHVSSPLWSCYALWGFEGLMTMTHEHPDLVRYACERYLARGLAAVRQAASAGAAGIWIEECMTDMISPAAFAALNLPYLRALVEAIRDAGMHSIYYYCGDPAHQWANILDTGADALSLEESKKGFVIDIADVVDRVRGRCVVLGNLDAIDLLRVGAEAELRQGILRQIAAAWRNGGRFIVSLGSPVTPETPVQRVRLYCDLCHELGRR